MVRVVTFATEPYRIYGPGTTDGIPYSAKEDAPRKPIPLKNIHREYRNSLGFADPRYRSLAPWCENGVLMLYNSWLVEPDSEQKGRFTYDTEPLVHEIFHRVNDNNPGCVFMFLGTGREKWLPKVDTKKHAVLLTTSPANAGQGFDPNVTPFLGSGVFKEASKLLGVTTDMWRLR
jgi:uracil-DNA glycosylase